MGTHLPKPVMATVTERHRAKQFHVGMAELNGWRNSMEDAHLVVINEDYGIFGVFDGHGGGACSKFAATRLKEEFEKHGKPKDDATVKQLFLSIDQEFLDTNEESGTTATMCVAHKPAAGGKVNLQVINAGDSRVLLGRRDGTIVPGGGTDNGLTRDHKPEDPAEKERIERCGGHVECPDGGVARVNGNLSVCRGFGDKSEKQTGGPGLEDHPVTADPEFGHFECDESDFLLLVCDGVSEGEFPNADVIKLVAERLATDNDPVAAAKAVCHKAVEMNSKDNITCMVVLCAGSSDTPGKTVDFEPGSISKLGHKAFNEAYCAMAERAGISMAEAVAKRYEELEAQKQSLEDPPEDWKKEYAMITDGGMPEGEAGSEERVAWFEKWLRNIPQEESGIGSQQDAIFEFLVRGGGLGGKAGGKGGYGGTGSDEGRAEHEP